MSEDRSAASRTGTSIHSGVTGNCNNFDKSLSQLLGYLPWFPRAAKRWVRGLSLAPLASSGFEDPSHDRMQVASGWLDVISKCFPSFAILSVVEVHIKLRIKVSYNSHFPQARASASLTAALAAFWSSAQLVALEQPFGLDHVKYWFTFSLCWSSCGVCRWFVGSCIVQCIYVWPFIYGWFGMLLVRCVSLSSAHYGGDTYLHIHKPYVLNSVRVH